MPFDAFQNPRVTVVAAHPDDETIGAGWLITKLRSPFLIHITDGSPRDLSDAYAAGFDNRQDYATARRIELYDALRSAGVVVGPGECETFALGVVDQEASFDMAGVTHKLAGLFRELRPSAVVTCAYEGGHPDHDATAFAVHAACSMLPDGFPIFEFPLYHARCEAGNERQGFMETGVFLPGQDEGRTVRLSGYDRARKERMIRCFKTQFHMLKNFPTERERFRVAPSYDFSEPPHPGKLLYEFFDWGIKGERWRQLALESAQELGLNAPI